MSKINIHTPSKFRGANTELLSSKPLKRTTVTASNVGVSQMSGLKIDFNRRGSNPLAGTSGVVNMATPKRTNRKINPAQYNIYKKNPYGDPIASFYRGRSLRG